MVKLSRGRIVLARMLDLQGRNPKERPVVVVTADQDILPEGEVQVVAVTGRLTDAPVDVQVPLPWDARKHPRTGLRKPSAAVCTWLASVPVADIIADIGIVPSQEMCRILELLDKLTTATEGAEASPGPDGLP